MVTLDEISAARPDVLFALYSLFDDDRRLILTEKTDDSGGFEVVEAHPNFRASATTNPRYGAVTYSGVKELNPALKDRLEPVEIKYMPADQEILYVMAETGAKEQVVTQLVDLAGRVREQSERLSATFSTRLVLDLATYSRYMPVYNAMKATLPAKMNTQAANTVLQMAASLVSLAEYNGE
jgi:MoxR-like ATPase